VRKNPSHVTGHIVVHPVWTDRTGWFRRANLPRSVHGYREERIALGDSDEPTPQPICLQGGFTMPISQMESRSVLGLTNPSKYAGPGPFGKSLSSSSRYRLPDITVRRCMGTLSLKETQALAQETELRLYECTICGTQNLYPVKDLSGNWTLEPHSMAEPRFSGDAAFLLGK
jgi:hypothetical protein